MKIALQAKRQRLGYDDMLGSMQASDNELKHGLSSERVLLVRGKRIA